MSAEPCGCDLDHTVKGEPRPHICARHTGNCWSCGVEFFFTGEHKVCPVCEQQSLPGTTGHS